jgi:mannose-6-phosphate isomerase
MKTADSPYNMNQPFKLKNPVQYYAWGSHTHIQSLTGASQASEPMAELWMGAHPVAPSQIFANNKWISLDDFIRQFPEQTLGAETAEKYQHTLPFLFKLLAAEKPLSVQAHPDKTQAGKGYARENRLGIAIDDPRRNYRDCRHKPECICALTPFTGLKGFRNIIDIGAQLKALCPESLAEELEILKRRGLKPFFKALMEIPAARKTTVIRETVKNAEADATLNPVFKWVLTLFQHYPEDIGILFPAILNLFRLSPGEALFLPAGELHAYLDGFGIEIMTNSDNVLRGGLTPKHIDVPELMNILNFSESTLSILRPEPVSLMESAYPTPAEEFSLSVITVTPPAIYDSTVCRGPEILLCTEGAASLSTADLPSSMQIHKGESVFIPAGVHEYKIAGDARIYKACVPIESPGIS